MNRTRIALGAFVWFLGMLIPTLHHGFYCLAISDHRSYSKNFLQAYRDLPEYDWLYLVAMIIVGAVLILAGLKPVSTLAKLP